MLTGKKLLGLRLKSQGVEEEDVTISTSFVTFEASLGGEALQTCQIHNSKVEEFKSALHELYKEFNVIVGGPSIRNSVLNVNMGLNMKQESGGSLSPVTRSDTGSAFVESKVQGSSTDHLSTTDLQISSDDTKELQQTVIWDELTQKQKDFIAEPFEELKSDIDDSQKVGYWNDFACRNDGYYHKDVTFYECDEIDITRLVTEEKDDDNKSNDLRLNAMKCKWHDYVKYRFNVLEKLVFPQILIDQSDHKDNYLNSPRNEDKLQFENLFRMSFKRNEIGCIRNNTEMKCTNFAAFERLMTYLVSIKPKKNNEWFEQFNNQRIKFLLVWNAVYIIFSKNQGSFVYGLDAEWYRVNNMGNNNNKPDFKQLTKEYILVNVTKSGMFGHSIYGTDEVKKGQLLSRVKKDILLWDSDEFDSLIDYCIQDIKDANIYKDTAYSGVEFFVITRLAYAICCGFDFKPDEFLMVSDILPKFYHTMLTIAMYVACYVTQSTKNSESFYIALILKLITDVMPDEAIMNLKDCSLYDYGTLLHSATLYNMRYYCNLLISRKRLSFDVFKKNKIGRHAYNIAIERERPSIVSLFELFINNKDKTKSQQFRAGEIELNYQLFANQKAAMLHLLHILGCELKPKSFDMKNASLYHNFTEFKGLKPNEYNDNNGFNFNIGSAQRARRRAANDLMKKVIHATMDCLKYKLPLSDDILVLCFVYCNECVCDERLKINLLNVLKECSQQCLDDAFVNQHTKARDTEWFRTYLLKSNVWSMSIGNGNGNEEEKEESKSNEQRLNIAYDMIDETVDQALISQKQYIWESIENELKMDEDSWQQLLNYQEYMKKGLKELRQDLVPNGLLPKLTENQLHIIAPTIGLGSNFDIFSEPNLKIYLTELLIFAHTINGRYQNDIKKTMHQIAKENDINKNSWYFQTAPVKLYERCVMKSQTDYASKKFPSAAHICDLVRSSLTFKNAKDLLLALNKFIEKCQNYETGCVIEVLRIKNGLSQILNWRSPQDCRYCDIKLNLLIYDKQRNECIVGELQFLLEWLLNAKKKGHKLYAMKRRRQYIEEINILSNSYENYKQYESKISELIVSNNLDYFSRELLWHPNLVLSMIDINKNKPILIKVGETDQTGMKLFEIFMACLHHYSEQYLSDSDNNNNNQRRGRGRRQDDVSSAFATQYLNYNKCKSGIVSGFFFWGMNAIAMSMESRRYHMFEEIMGSKYFNGLSQMGRFNNQNIIYWCVRENCFEYLKLICKHCDKNYLAIGSGIEYIDIAKQEGPLITLVKSKHCSEKWLNLLLFETYNSVKKLNISNESAVFDAKYLQQAYDYLQQKYKNDNDNDSVQKWKNIIVSYANETGQKINNDAGPDFKD